MQNPPPAAPPGASPPAGGSAPAHLTLVGAGHVFRIRETIRDAIVALHPDIVALELDKARFESLVARERGAAPATGGSLVQRRMAKFQEDIAGMYGAQVGEEMLAGAEGAQLVGAKLALVDDDVRATLQRALKQLTWKERMRGVGMVAAGAAKSILPSTRRRAKAKVEDELRAYSENPASMLGELERKFPTIHRVLIAERNQRMASRIRSLLVAHPRAVAVVGDGHVDGMVQLLADLHPTVYRLTDVREGRLPRGPVATGTPASVSFGWTMGRPPS